jgi:hypothetical protein
VETIIVSFEMSQAPMDLALLDSNAQTRTDYAPFPELAHQTQKPQSRQKYRLRQNKVLTEAVLSQRKSSRQPLLPIVALPLSGNVHTACTYRRMRRGAYAYAARRLRKQSVKFVFV